MQPCEELADTVNRPDVGQAALIGLAVPFPGLVAVLLIPCLPGNRFDVEVAAFADVPPQGLVVRPEAKGGKRLAPGRDVLGRIVDQRAVDIEEQHPRAGHQPSIELAVMAKKATKAGQKKPSKPAATTGRTSENAIERIAEELEARVFEGAELANRTTSAETNIALAALGAIEGPHAVQPEAQAQAAHGKRKTARRKSRQP